MNIEAYKDIKLKINKVYEDRIYDQKREDPVYIKIVHILPSFEEDEEENQSWNTAIGITVYKNKNKKWAQRSYSLPFLYDAETGSRRDRVTGLHALVEIGTDEARECESLYFEKWCEEKL